MDTSKNLKQKPFQLSVALNAICPYFTMFPLDFPLKILKRRAREGDVVLDPFCGRGTTNFAARIVQLESLGIDSSPVASAITAAKLVTSSSEEIVKEATRILQTREAEDIPLDEFWKFAFHESVLESLCKFREAFLEECVSEVQIALRGIILGALHGPKQKSVQSYFSNQCPRTYAPKPAYAMRFWRERNLQPDPVDVLELIERRANRYYNLPHYVLGSVRLGDCRSISVLKPEKSETRFRWIITSPPYYGMRTYIPDQWLRNWFVGGPDCVDYSNRDQLQHSSPNAFAEDLRKVWRNIALVRTQDASLVIRFGGISDRRADPLKVIKSSLRNSGWKIKTIRKAGSSADGKRQADSFLKKRTSPLSEYDVWARCE